MNIAKASPARPLKVTYAKLILTATFWGGTFIAGRTISATVAPFSAAFIRFVIASFVLVLVLLRVEGRFPKISPGQAARLILLGLTGVFLYNYCFFQGLKYIPASRAALIVATQPVVIALFSAVIFRERLTALKGAGIMLSVIGAMIVIARGNPLQLFANAPGHGDLLFLGCVASWVFYSLLGKSVMKEISPLVLTTCASIVGAVALSIGAWQEQVFDNLTSFSLINWAGFSYLGLFGTVVGFVWYSQGIRDIGAARAGQFISLVPVSAIALGALVLGEPLTLALLLGGFLVVGGVLLTNLQREPACSKTAGTIQLKA